MTQLDTIVAKFRAKNQNIAAAFDEVQRRLVLLEAPVPPPPPPPPPPPTATPYWREEFSAQPASWWSYAYNGSNDVGWGNSAFQLLDNGEGGKALRIGSPPNAPGGAGVLGALWSGGSQTYGAKDQSYWLQTRFRFQSIFNGWLLEQHENSAGHIPNMSRQIYSNAIGITTDRKLLVQQTGGELSLHPSPQGWQTKDTETLVPDKWYVLTERCIWSPDPTKGMFAVYLNGRLVNSSLMQRATLLTERGYVDAVGLGLYSYPYTPQAGATYVDFDYFTIGPSRESVGF